MSGTNEIELKDQGEEMVDFASDLMVNSSYEMMAANDFLISIRQGKKSVTSFFKDMKANAHKAWRTICDKEKRLTDVFDKADVITSKKILAYRDVERRKAAEAQRKAEQERLDRERREREKLLRQAERAEQKGDEEKADLLLDQATEVYAPPVIHESTVQKTEVSDMGTTTGVKDWEIERVNNWAIIQAIANGDLPRTIIEIKDSKIKQWARAMNIDNYNKNGLRVRKIEGRLTTKAAK